MVFDTVQTISKEIIDRLYMRGIKGSNYDLAKHQNFAIDTLPRVMYRKNIEVITDPTYKKTKRAQIKDLLSLTRMSTYKPTKRTTKEYAIMGDMIVNSYMNGDNVGFYDDENKAKEISKLWDLYGEDENQIKKAVDINDSNLDKLIFNSETVVSNRNLNSIPVNDLNFIPFNQEDYLVQKHLMIFLKYSIIGMMVMVIKQIIYGICLFLEYTAQN